MTKNLQEFLKKKNTAQEFTVEEVLEFTDSNLEDLAREYEDAVQREESSINFNRTNLYSLVVEFKQLRDKLQEINEKANK